MDSSPTWPAPLDLVGLGLMAVLLFLGLYRGLWWQVIRLVGVTLSVFVARAMSPFLAERLAALFPDLESRTTHGLAWAGMFAISMLACALIGLLGQRMLEAMNLGLANRLAGALAGAATGFTVHVALIVLLCQLAPTTLLGRYLVGTYSERVYATLGGRRQIVLAAEAAQEVDLAIESGRASLPPDERPPRLEDPTPEDATPVADPPNRVR